MHIIEVVSATSSIRYLVVLHCPFNNFRFFHFQYEMSIFYIGLGSKECNSIVCETLVITLLPLALIKVVEIISPVQVEIFCFFIINISLNIVILSFPWHIIISESSRPVWVLWSPQIHHEHLFLVKVLNGSIPLCCVANFFSIN